MPMLSAGGFQSVPTVAEMGQQVGQEYLKGPSDFCVGMSHALNRS